MVMLSHIQKMDPNRRIWVVRADSGNFIENFRQEQCAAVGFVDNLSLENNHGSNFYIKSGDLIQLMSGRDEYKDEDGNIKVRSIESHAHQTRRFLFEMNIGDWIVTPDGGSINFGRITGHPYISRNPVVYQESEKSKPVIMYFQLRRKVEWGPIIYRQDFPYAVRKALFARMAVYNIDAHAEIIYHLIYPYFFYKDKFHLSFKVNQHDRINNYSVRRLLEFIDLADVVGQYFVHENWQKLDFESFLYDSLSIGELSATTKAQFFSEGDVWTAFAKLGSKTTSGLAIAFLASAVVFGNSHLGFDGVLDKEMRHKIFEIVAEQWQKKQGDAVRKQLQLGMPNFETEPLESNKFDEPPISDQIAEIYKEEAWE